LWMLINLRLIGLFIGGFDIALSCTYLITV
jgi:hypothetical protein